MKKLLFPLLIFLSNVTFGQETFSPLSVKNELFIENTQDKISIDGILNESAWESSRVISDFIQIEPYQGEKSRFRTEVRILQNAQFIFIGVKCFDPNGKNKLRVPELKRDFSWSSNDTFAVGFDGFQDERNTVTLAVNPYGAQKDYLSYDDVLFDFDWNGLWQVRTSISDQGWFAEFAIPFKSLRYDSKKIDQVWGINFVRRHRESNEVSAWSPYPRSFGFNRAEYFGKLTGLEVPQESNNIQVNPYFLWKEESNREVQTKRLGDIEVGGEIKWVINPHLIADLTVNTDFAQADADFLVNNTSRFSIFFPERRQFFLENASLFGTGLNFEPEKSGNMRIIPFFSRKVGLNEDRVPIPINFGLRLVNKDLNRNSGLMYVNQGHDSDRSDILILRHVQNLGKQHRVGILYTGNQLESKFNQTIALDGFFRITNKQNINFMLIGSARPNSKLRSSGFLQYQYRTNNVNHWFTSSFVENDFNPELGFVSRQNVISNTLGSELNYRGKNLPFKKIIRAFIPNMNVNFYNSPETLNLQEFVFNVSPIAFNFHNNANFLFGGQHQIQIIDKPFYPVGLEIGVGDYIFNRFFINARTDPSYKINLDYKFSMGGFYSYKLNEHIFKISYLPIPHIGFTVGFNRNYIRSSSDFTRTINLINAESRIYLNPRLQFYGIVQANSFNNEIVLNNRLSWEFKPLSFLHLVYNRGEISQNMEVITNEQIIMKISYLKQF